MFGKVNNNRPTATDQSVTTHNSQKKETAHKHFDFLMNTIQIIPLQINQEKLDHTAQAQNAMQI